MIITKSDVLNGEIAREEVYIKAWDKEVSLKPLNDGELSEIEAKKKDIGKIKANLELDKTGNIDTNRIKNEAMKKALKKDMELDIDVMKSEIVKYEANCLTAAYGLSNDQEQWTPEEVKSLRPAGVVKEIAEAVLKISKVDNLEKLQEEVKDFRPE